MLYMVPGAAYFLVPALLLVLTLLLDYFHRGLNETIRDTAGRLQERTGVVQERIGWLQKMQSQLNQQADRVAAGSSSVPEAQTRSVNFAKVRS